MRQCGDQQRRTLGAVGALAIVVGAVGVAIGWHWKLMHRSWQDLRQVKEQAKGKLPALKTARSHHTSIALLFAVFAVVLIAVALH
jgi:hypothetical protein